MSSATGRLVSLDATNWRSALDVWVTDEQLPLAGDHQPLALVILAKSQVGERGWTWEPLAWQLDDGRIVAVRGLAHDGATARMNNVAVDHRVQRTGVGTAFLQAVIEHARHGGSQRVILTVHPDNTPAQALYRKVGMEPTGEIQGIEPVFAIDL